MKIKGLWCSQDGKMHFPSRHVLFLSAHMGGGGDVIDNWPRFTGIQSQNGLYRLTAYCIECLDQFDGAASCPDIT